MWLPCLQYKHWMNVVRTGGGVVQQWEKGRYLKVDISTLLCQQQRDGIFLSLTCLMIDEQPGSEMLCGPA